MSFAGADMAGQTSRGNDVSGAASAAANASGSTGSTAEKPKLPAALPADLQTIVKNWTMYISELQPGPAKAGLQKARLSTGDRGQLLVVFDNYIMLERFQKNKEACADRLRDLIRSKIGKDFEIEYGGLDRKTDFTENYIDLSSVNWDDIQLLEE